MPLFRLIFVLVLAILYAITRLNANSKRLILTERLSFLLRERLMIAVFLATILVVGAEAGTVGILTTYLMDRGFTWLPKIGLVVFLSGIAAGRVILGIITPKEKLTATSLDCSICCYRLYRSIFHSGGTVGICLYFWLAWRSRACSR
jgi:uncharacterized membrane protein YciS (DUF1049 family)